MSFGKFSFHFRLFAVSICLFCWGWEQICLNFKSEFPAPLLSRCRREKRSAFIYLQRKQSRNRNLLHISRGEAQNSERCASNSISFFLFPSASVFANRGDGGPLFACRIVHLIRFYFHLFSAKVRKVDRQRRFFADAQTYFKEHKLTALIIVSIVLCRLVACIS